MFTRSLSSLSQRCECFLNEQNRKNTVFDCRDISKKNYPEWRNGSSKAKKKSKLYCNRGNNILNLRMFNNWAKSFLMLNGVNIHSDQSLIGLDLGCNQGGDLKKWHHCKIERLYLVEDNSVAMSECRKRYANLSESWSNFYEASFVEEDFTTSHLDIPEAVDIVSSQMSLHKAFQSQEKAECMAWNVGNALKCGGTFVVSITNASIVIDSLKKSSRNLSFGNEIHKVQISKPLPKNIPQFGFSFEFSVGSNVYKEYLVQLPVLEKLMARHGLLLEERCSFLDMYFSARKDSEHLKCLQKMGVVREGINKRDRYKVYLNMSDQEIQAATLYDALTFRKVLK